ncbi:FMN-dependent NADH-azoreductase [Candidatus Mycoplasma mahonii]|uniref:FMN-dependent NADH-azoreductase n=1 Tax=Candidatus Mycoplasma mahonii TaxID=3004105 RepID=UPI0026F33BD1|nr:FMN-dependent NADH-azoreductase [Candidatus Mycoplasma mahonii]WKX02172.1 FMN-dependent NADH-azoreductase [Candidatus Mycoplasma mahonii]
MAKILVIKTSMTTNTPRGSISSAALDKFMEIYQSKNVSDEVFILDLNKDPIGKNVLTDESFSDFWAGADHYINQLKNVDKLVLASPMTNFNYTAVLKNYLDTILMAGKTFKYKYDGKGKADGLVKNLKVQLITSQGAPKGWYPFGDHTISLTGTFKFMGSEVVKPVIIAGVKTPEMINLSKDEVIAIYLDDIKTAAESF